MSNSAPANNHLGSSQTGNHSEAYYEAQYLNNIGTEIKNIQTDIATINQEVANIEQLEHIAIPNAIKELENFLGGPIGLEELVGDYYSFVCDAYAENCAASYIENVTNDQQLQQALGALNAALGINPNCSDLNAAMTLLNIQTNYQGTNIDLGEDIVGQILNVVQSLVSQDQTNMQIKAENKFHLASQTALEKDYLANMQTSLNASSVLNTISSIEASAVSSLDASIRAEKYDLHNHSALWHIFHAIGFTPSQMAERDQKQYNLDCVNAINTIGDTLSSFLGSFQNDVAFSQVTSLLNQLIKKMKEILNDKKMPLAEKLNDLLSLLTEVLAIFNMIQQTTENQKTENEKRMAKADQTQANNSIQEALLNDKILANAVADEKSAHIIQSVTTWLMLVVSAVTASPAFFLFMCVMTGLQQSGDLSKWTNELGDKMGAKWKADLVMAAIELAASGVFIGLEAGINATAKVTEQVVEETTESVLINVDDEAMNSATSELVQCSGDAEFTDDDAEETLVNVSKKAASMATKLVKDEYFKLSPVVRMAMERKALEKTTQTVIKSAVEHAIEEAVVSAKKNVGNAISEELETEIAATAAARAVSEVSTMSADEAKIAITRTAKGSFENLKQLLKRALFTFAYTLGNSNFVMDIATEEAKKNGKKLDTLDAILAGIAQAILTIIGMIGAMGSSSLDPGSKMTTILKFQKIAAAAQSIGQLSGARSDLEVANVLEIQARATFNTQEQTSYQNILSNVFKALQKEQNESARQASAEWLTETNSLNKFALHIQDANKAGIKVLMEQSV
jgi:predicted house-cleaning noncanonical NTP pyrophosphatase (MazG superfamily)